MVFTLLQAKMTQFVLVKSQSNVEIGRLRLQKFPKAHVYRVHITQVDRIDFIKKSCLQLLNEDFTDNVKRNRTVTVLIPFMFCCLIYMGTLHVAR